VLHERVESARRRTGPILILRHGSHLDTEELGPLAKLNERGAVSIQTDTARWRSGARFCVRTVSDAL